MAASARSRSAPGRSYAHHAQVAGHALDARQRGQRLGKRGQRPQLREALADEVARQRPVAIQDGAGAWALGHLEGDLRAGLEQRPTAGAEADAGEGCSWSCRPGFLTAGVLPLAAFLRSCEGRARSAALPGPGRLACELEEEVAPNLHFLAWPLMFTPANRYEP